MKSSFKIIFIIIALCPPYYMSGQKVKERPNIILILIDDMGWKDIGCAGSTYYQTPNIDQLAAEGIRFDRAYSTSPICSPSRGAILSGKSPARTGLTSVFNPILEDSVIWHPYSKSEISGKNSQYKEAMNIHMLPLSEYTFAEALSDNSYKTGYLGKWHVGWSDNFAPDHQGFEYAEGYRTTPTGTKGHFGKHYIGKVKGLEGLKPDDDMADVLTEKAVQFIKKNKDGPFMLMLSHYAVHAPFEAKKEVIEKYKKIPGTDQNYPVYAAMVESVDNSVGRITKVLKELGLEENTMIVFTSDNGGLTQNTERSKYSPTSNYPLLGGKSMAYEASMRVPLIIKWPKLIKPGQVSNHAVSSLDLYPTFMEVAGVTTKIEQILDGQSILPLLSGRELENRPLYFHFPHYTDRTSPYSIIMDGNWKLIRFYNDKKGGMQLFDMKNDPYEQKDVSNVNPEIAKELNHKLTVWLKSVDAKLPRPNENFDPNKPATRTGTDSYETAILHRKQAEKRLEESLQKQKNIAPN